MGKICIINGSPRKNWNTYKMCESFANGAKFANNQIDTEIINLYDINFTGCRSCFSCKLKDGKNYGKCSYPDELPPVLEKIYRADGIVFASPIYMGGVTGMMHCFMERLLFPFFQYKPGFPMLVTKKPQTAVIYTMNVSEGLSNQMYLDVFNKFEQGIEASFTKPVRICAYDTCQFGDYSKYVCEVFDPNHKQQQLNEQLPKDMEIAYKAGAEMAKRIFD